MSAFEQKREIPNRALQYMVVRLSFYSFLAICHAAPNPSILSQTITSLDFWSKEQGLRTRADE